MSDDQAAAVTVDGQNDQDKAATFTQADVDRIVRERVQRERAKYADYDDLKAKADGAKTVEDRLAEIESKHAEAERRAMRAEIANAKGLTPTQAKRLIGTTREELEADADELLRDLATVEADRKKTGARAPLQGRTPTNGADDPMREFVRNLVKRD